MMRTESMTRTLLPTLIVLGIGALAGGARVAGAQRPESSSPATFAAEASPATASNSPAMPVPSMAFRVEPVIRSSLVLARPATALGAHGATPPVAIDWRMPSSNALMIGGAATAAIGVLVVKNEVGATMGIAGTVAALYGLYLRYR
jgi:hypothetical protein